MMLLKKPISLSYCQWRKLSSKCRRVVVTGMGAVCPVGLNVKQSWETIIAGGCGIRKLDERYNNLPCKIAGVISSEELNVEGRFKKSELRTMTPAITYAMIAAEEALKDSKYECNDEESLNSTGVAVGIGMVDLEEVLRTNESLLQGYNKVSPFFVPKILPNMAAGQISMKFGFRGPNHSVSTACATGAHSIGDAFRFIRNGDATVMLAGGAEACISPLAIAAFCRLRALCTSSNDNPEKASRPFDRDRNGFVMGEGSAIFVLEELEHALGRNAQIYAEILGYGLSSDASHLTSPREDGMGATLAMSRALKDANVNSNDISYVNAHATSTPIGDAIETRAIKTIFGDHSPELMVSSTKGAHGHLLGAAGNIETVFTVMAIKTGIVPPTINLENLTEDMDLNYVPNKSCDWKSCDKRIALKNAFGFGGTNASLCIGEYREI
ncbi:3-oxoacyl-[acyl-carrier-protein] synthase, mitochondrial-like [Ctenocephalides felis]|uniref:3-oxoacyl-[acyl-carrier-protein] synthase, mitochondrial-like n=1 Tax=Ctenocephalides felis TaxID=7515 RepID=UPI000E6E2C91|nr:3-oxoacyl-[acyl-carrier-protein] synthase, mitochondrial-like [Ctenocephalides felis]